MDSGQLLGQVKWGRTIWVRFTNWRLSFRNTLLLLHHHQNNQRYRNTKHLIQIVVKTLVIIMILRTPPLKRKAQSNQPEDGSPSSGNRQLVIFEDTPLPESSHHHPQSSDQMLCTYQCRQMVFIHSQLSSLLSQLSILLDFKFLIQGQRAYWGTYRFFFFFSMFIHFVL